jgi:hypothetical protein
MKPFRPFFFIASLVAIVSLACGAFSSGDQPEQPQQEVPQQVESPTQAPQQELPPPTEEPVEEQPVESSSGPYFTEEFDSDPQWYYEVIQGNDSSDLEKATYKFDFGRMIFNIEDPGLFAYYVYEGDIYENVRVDIKVENRGVNTQQVSLLCQVSDDGWYEWAVQSDGRWELYAVSDGYKRMHNGASNYIKQGKDVNEYAMICEGNEISFFVNGVEPKGSPYEDRKYALRRGNVGFSVSSLRAIPVNMEVDWFKISEP